MSWVLDEKVLAVLALLVVAVLIVFQAAQMIYAGRVVEPFSELGLLGPGGKIGDYPRQVAAGTPFLLHVYIGNHEGRTCYYRVLAKIGNSSSVIDETTPLSAEPIMDLRAVLSHNSSTILPVSLVTQRPATNARLVLELWVFNETLREFVYHGRWNQLWLNITATQLSEPPATQLKTLSPEAEAMLLDAYFSVRRAEKYGGNTTRMVSTLNSAIEHAQNGDYEEAERLVEQVLLLEPEAVQRGLENKHVQLLNTFIIPSYIVAAALGLFLLLRKRIWLVLLKAYGNWAIVPLDKRSLGSTTLGKKVKNSSPPGRMLKVSDVVALGEKLGQEKWLVAREVFSWARSKAVRLEDLNPPRSFAAYLFSAHNLGFATVLVLIALTVLTIYVPQVNILRSVLGSLFVLFLPGYSLVNALYPRENELDKLERLALSIGLSLALVPLVGLFLNYTPWGIRLDPIVVSLSLLTVSLTLLASYRKYSLLKPAIASYRNDIE